MKKSVKILCVFAFMKAVTLMNADASKIEVINENKKSLTIKIRGISKLMSSFIKEIPAAYNSSFCINKEDIKGNQFYSITGVTNMITPSGKCEFLNIDKNYQITFIDDMLGTTCIAEELPQVQPM